MSCTSDTESQSIPTDVPVPYNMSIVNEKKKYSSIWNLVFSTNNENPWISFKPQLGIHVYPCYACRDMFGSRSTFQDHTNRRAILIKYKCGECKEQLTFYNRCALLLHIRTHFSLVEGKLDLNHLEILSLPFGMMGFLPYPGIGMLFDSEEDIIEDNQYINTQFYSPDDSEKGKQIVTLKPNDLLFCSSDDDPNVVQLTLKQISKNIPLCQFVTLDHQKKLRQNFSFIDNSVRVKEEIVDSNDNSERSPSPVSNDNEVQIPVISQIESLPSEESGPRCPECKTPQKYSMKIHFTGKNMPFDESLKCTVCKYIASTKCSYSAHQRIHANVAPFICPECGTKFESRKYLMKHVDDVCFHLAKQIRIRCPGKRCGKLLASAATFTAHFAQHVNPWFKCNLCKCCFSSLMEFKQHSATHSTPCTPDRVFKCSGCKNEDSIIFQENVPQHIDYHSKDRSRCMYVFICKFCKNYFRSTVTFATHLSKCQRMQESKKLGYGFTVDYCIRCSNRIIFYENDKSTTCSKCHYLTLAPPERRQLVKISENEKRPNENDTINSCMLCGVEILDNNFKAHKTRCTYRNPVIVLNRLTEEIIAKHSDAVYDPTVLQDSIPDSNASDVIINVSSENSPHKSSDSLDSNDSSKQRLSSSSPKSLNGAKRKRKRAPFVFRDKRPTLFSPPEEVIDQQADEPMPFDGTYHCKLCDFQEVDRDKFHEHITCHRDISTAYQCMECGECFVVKPSLIKHLMHYHKIEDANAYFDSNDCYDRGAVQELKDIMNLAPGESREPVGENQCRVCLQQFSDSQELSKHFRIHGMAFLMKNTRD